jgi:hypothetical protein
VEHDEQKMVVLYNHLVGRSEGENTTTSSCGSPDATHVPGSLGWFIGSPLWERIADIREHVAV